MNVWTAMSPNGLRTEINTLRRGGLQVMRPILYPFQNLFLLILLRLHCDQAHPPTLMHRLPRRQLNRV